MLSPVKGLYDQIQEAKDRAEEAMCDHCGEKKKPVLKNFTPEGWTAVGGILLCYDCKRELPELRFTNGLEKSDLVSDRDRVSKEQ